MASRGHKSREKKVKRVGKYELSTTLGEGTFGKVKLGVHQDTHERVAVKILDKVQIQQQNMGGQVKKEISIMKQLKHPNVVMMKEVLASRTKIFIVIEFISGGELFTEIVKHGKFTEPVARRYFRQLISGVRYCHAQGVCHRDLKPENLLLDENKNLKITDFGLSNFVDGGERPPDETAIEKLLHTTCGTPNYVAPEVLADKGYDGKIADIWSSGVILYVLLAGFLPFDEKQMADLFRKIQRAEFQYPGWFTSSAKNLMNLIFVTDPHKRIKIDDIMRHPWFKEGYPDGVAPAIIPITSAADDIANAVRDVEVIEKETARAPSGAPTKNAFDLISMVGGHALDNMLNYVQTKRTAAHVSWMRFYNYQTTLSIADIRATITRVMAANPMSTIDTETEVRNPYKMRININRKGQTCELRVEIFEVLPQLHIVEIHRGKGNSMAYFKFMAELDAVVSRALGGKAGDPTVAVGASATTKAPPLP